MNYNGLLDIDLLEAYLDGKLGEKAMHQVEKLSLEDPFVAEALAGLSQSALRSQSLSILQKRLHDRIAQKPIETKRWTITSQRLSIASAAAVLFIVISVLFWMKENSRRQLEANQAKNVKIEIAPIEEVETVTVPSGKAEVEIDKAVVDVKTNSYARIKKSKAIVTATEVTPVVASAPVIMAETKDEVMNDAKATGSARRLSVITSKPIKGWVKFEEYVLLNNKLIINNQMEGKSVQLSFNIDEKNRPTAIKIVSGLSTVENDEAIRLLKFGPDWNYIPNQKEPVMVNIKF